MGTGHNRRPSSVWPKSIGWRLIALAISASTLTYVVSHFAASLQAKSVRVISDKVVDGGAFGDDFVRHVAAFARTTGPSWACEQGSSEEFATLAVFVAGSAVAAREGGMPLPEARRLLVSALECSPSKPFLWFLLFWVESRTDVRKALPFLDMSYRLGPHEGWLAPARNRAAMGILGEASPNLKASVMSEYARLATDDFETALGLFMGADEAARRHMSQALFPVPSPIRAQFRRRLEEADIKTDLAP